MLNVGDQVEYRDAHKRQTLKGEITGQKRSSNGPWQVCLIRLADGKTVEVHPDRIKKLK